MRFQRVTDVVRWKSTRVNIYSCLLIAYVLYYWNPMIYPSFDSQALQKFDYDNDVPMEILLKEKKYFFI